MIILRTSDELRDHLGALNFDHGVDTAAVVVQSTLWLAYCTDPDGEWFFESGDPIERMQEREADWVQYDRVGFDFVGPQIDSGSGVIVVWPQILTTPGGEQ